MLESAVNLINLRASNMQVPLPRKLVAKLTDLIQLQSCNGQSMVEWAIAGTLWPIGWALQYAGIHNEMKVKTGSGTQKDGKEHTAECSIKNHTANHRMNLAGGWTLDNCPCPALVLGQPTPLLHPSTALWHRPKIWHSRQCSPRKPWRNNPRRLHPSRLSHQSWRCLLRPSDALD